MNAAGACDVVIISWACDLVGGAASGMFEEMITGLANAVFSFALMLLSWVWSAISATTVPQTSADWLYTWAGRVFALTLPITVGLLILQIVTIVLRSRSSAGIGRAVAMAGVAVFGTSVSLPVIHLITTAVDGVADGMTELTFGDMDQIGQRLRAVLDGVVMVDEATGGLNFGLLGAGSVLAGAVAFIIFGILLVMGALAVWAALLIRSMLLYITIVLAPIAIMGLAWDYTRGWFKRWVAVVNTLVWSKLAVMIVFGLGVSAIEGADFGTDGAGAVGVLLSGALMMLMAALIPVACFSFMSFLGDEVHASTLHRSGKAAASAGKDALARANPTQVLGRLSAGSPAGSADAQPSGGHGPSGAPPKTPPQPGGGESTPNPDSQGHAGDEAAPLPQRLPGETGWHRIRRSTHAGAAARHDVDARGERAGGATVDASALAGHGSPSGPTSGGGDAARPLGAPVEGTPGNQAANVVPPKISDPARASGRAADRWRAVAGSENDTASTPDTDSRQ